MHSTNTQTIKIKLRTIVLDCKDARVLSDLYAKLLGWNKTIQAPDWVLMIPQEGQALSFQSEPLYQALVWLEKEGLT